MGPCCAPDRYINRDAGVRTPKRPVAADTRSGAHDGLSEASDPNGITVFEAMEKELGPKLVKQKRSIPMIVVDHLEEKPVR